MTDERKGAPGTWAVIFSSRRRPGDEGYAAMAERMLALAALQPGYLGVDSARGADGFGITVSYWDSLEAVAAWKRDAEHREAQRLGRERWYADFELQVARIEYGRRFAAGSGGADE